MNNETKEIIRSILTTEFGIEETTYDEGVSFVDFDVESKIYFEDDKVIYEMNAEDASITIKASKALFLSDVAKATSAIFNWGMAVTEGDRENSLYDDEDNEDFVRESEVIEIDDENFFDI